MENNISEEQFDNHPAKPEWPEQKPDKNQNGFLVGVAVIFLGIIVFFRNTDFFDGTFLETVFSIPIILMLIAILIGYKNNFKTRGWIVPFIIGALLLLRRYNIDIGQFILPIILIGVGTSIILRNKKGRATINYDEHPGASVDAISVDALFSSANRFVTTPNFVGGTTSSIFSGVKIDCKDANLQKDAVLDTTVFCGSLELIVPANWIIVNEASTILGAVEDQRQRINLTGFEHKLILRGSVICGGIDIKSY